MTDPTPAVDAFIARAPRWGAEMAALREIALGCGLDEAIKWGKPCFTHRGGNIAILQPFKDECRLMFFKGALLPDPGGLLTSQGENTQGALVFRTTGVGHIEARTGALRALVVAAVAAEEAGLKVGTRKDLDPPPELAVRFAADPGLAVAFGALTPGRQRAYVLHIGGAAKAETREARIDQCAPRILAGKGLTDR